MWPVSRKQLGDFPLSEHIKGYWDRSGVEIDLVAVSEPTRRIRFGTCKRNADKLPGSIAGLKENAAVFLRHHGQFGGWAVEYCAIAPSIAAEVRRRLASVGVTPQSLGELLGPFSRQTE